MDSNTTAVVGYVSIILSVGTILLGVVNHKRIRSNCCGRKVDVSLDVENTTPPQGLPKIEIPK
jgi:hypothetical protein